MLRHAIKRRGNIFEVPGSRFLVFLLWADGLQSYHDAGLTHHLLEIMFELQKVDEVVKSDINQELIKYKDKSEYVQY